MDQYTMQRLLRLAQKTGSPVIMTDLDGSEPSVLMPLETYEAMIDALTLDEDTPEDGSEEYQDDIPFEAPLQEVNEDMSFPGEEQEASEEFSLEDVPFDPPIPEAPQQTQVKTDDLGEERFYLEPIE